MSTQSSKQITISSLKVYIKFKGADKWTISNLNMIDLSGSEYVPPPANR
jgi:hypothetical protein